MSQSRTTVRPNQPVRVLPGLRPPAVASAGFAVTAAGCREFVRSARLRPFIAGELRRWRAGRDLVAVGAAIRTAFADAEWPVAVAGAIAAGYARLGGDGTVVTVRSVGACGCVEVFRELDTTGDVLAACKRCYAALFTAEAIAGRADRGVDQLEVAVSLGIERETRPAAALRFVTAAAADCSGYVVDDAELRRLAAWTIAVEHKHTRRSS